MQMTGGYIPVVPITCDDCYQYAELESLANYTINRKSLKPVDELLDELSEKYKGKLLFLDSGGYQSKVGRITKQNINKHIDYYYAILERIGKYDNLYLYSLDFPPCMPSKFTPDAITPEESGKYTLETYKTISEIGNRDKVIIVTHYMSSTVFQGWYKIFEQLQDKLREFKYFATGVLTKHQNTRVMSLYTGAKIFLRFFNIKPKKFHFLGTSTPKLLYPLYRDNDLEHITFDKTIHMYLGQASIPFYVKSIGKYIYKNVSLKRDLMSVINIIEDENIKKELTKLIGKIGIKRQDNQIFHPISRLLECYSYSMLHKLLNEDKVYVKFDYNVELDAKLYDEIQTYDQFLQILKIYFDPVQGS